MDNRRFPEKVEFGIASRNATFVSIVIDLLLFFLLGALLLIAAFGTMLEPQLVVHILSLIVPVPLLAIDLLTRYDSYLREDASPWGLFEWVASRRKRVK